MIGKGDSLEPGRKLSKGQKKDIMRNKNVRKMAKGTRKGSTKAVTLFLYVNNRNNKSMNFFGRYFNYWEPPIIFTVNNRNNKTMRFSERFLIIGGSPTFENDQNFVARPTNLERALEGRNPFAFKPMCKIACKQ